MIKPCIGCGYCCKKAMCFIGIVIYGRPKDNCPYLIWSNTRNRYLCQLVISNESFINKISIGEGCGSPLNTWRNQVKERN